MKKAIAKHPEKDIAVPVRIRDNEGSVVTSTINLTSSGAYCKTDKPLPLLTKVVLTLLVPQPKKAKGGKKIECKGTVVRIHPVIVDNKAQSYDVAIYFDELSPQDRELISQYVAVASIKNR